MCRSKTGFAHKVELRPVVRPVPTQSRMLDKVGTHHERRFNIPSALSDSLIGISSDSDSSESLSRGNSHKTGTFVQNIENAIVN